MFTSLRVQELCEGRGGRPRLTVPDSPHGFRVQEPCERERQTDRQIDRQTDRVTERETDRQIETERAQVDVLGSPSLIVFMVSEFRSCVKERQTDRQTVRERQ